MAAISPLPAPASFLASRLLAVDDDRTLLRLLATQLESLGHDCQLASSGEEALHMLETLESNQYPAAILLDREMPGMGGIALVQHLKTNPAFRTIPVIMLTGSNQPEQIGEGLNAGVFYYLSKPIQSPVLTAVLAAALRESDQKRRMLRDMQHHRATFPLLESAQLSIRTLSEAEDAACFLATAFPDPQRTVSGMVELLFNAIEHGNLGIGYAEKSRLVEQGIWRAEIERRLALPEYATKRVKLVYQRRTDGHYLQIQDQGAGFDWQPYLRIDPSRATHNHGRGIAQANLLAFDALHYQAPGNQLLAMVRHATPNEEAFTW